MSNTTHTTQNWEIRFDERFVYGDNWATYADGNSPSQYGPKHVKDFIRKEIADARREVIEEIEKLQKDFRGQASKLPQYREAGMGKVFYFEGDIENVLDVAFLKYIKLKLATLTAK